MGTNLVVNQPGGQGRGAGWLLVPPLMLQLHDFPTKSQRLFPQFGNSLMEWRLLKVTPPTCRGREPYNKQGESKRDFHEIFLAQQEAQWDIQWNQKQIFFLQWRTLSQTNCNLYDNFLYSFAGSSSLITICKYSPLAKIYWKTPKTTSFNSDGVCSVQKNWPTRIHGSTIPPYMSPRLGTVPCISRSQGI